MKRKQTIYGWLTTNFSVIIRNEENFSLKRSFRTNYARILVFFSMGFSISAAGTLYVLHLIDHDGSGEARREKEYNQKLMSLAMAVDSLEKEISLRDTFIIDLKKTITGEVHDGENERLKTRQENKLESERRSVQDTIATSELALRKEFERNDVSAAIKIKSPNTRIVPSVKGFYDIFFFPPVSGLVSNQYNPKIKHFGVDIIAKENEPIKCVAEGSVIYSGWSYDTGYMLVIQHYEDLISVYKHNSSLLKKVGDNVQSGEVVAIIGNSGEITTGTHLHFELWYKGNHLNPLDYIVF